MEPTPGGKSPSITSSAGCLRILRNLYSFFNLVFVTPNQFFCLLRAVSMSTKDLEFLVRSTTRFLGRCFRLPNMWWTSQAFDLVGRTALHESGFAGVERALLDGAEGLAGHEIGEAGFGR